MVSLGALWLPILLAAVVVFVASSILHMALKYHNREYRRLPDEDTVLAALGAARPSPGFYMFPYASDPKECSTPAMVEKFERGPVGTMNVNPSGPPTMGPALALWFAYCLLVGLFVAYIASRTLAAGTPYLQVFRVAGCTAFMAFALAHLSDGIWKMKPWSMVLKHSFDGLVYGLLTGGVFGWLWPA
jgi:hypothetical protein